MSILFSLILPSKALRLFHGSYEAMACNHRNRSTCKATSMASTYAHGPLQLDPAVEKYKPWKEEKVGEEEQQKQVDFTHFLTFHVLGVWIFPPWGTFGVRLTNPSCHQVGPFCLPLPSFFLSFFVFFLLFFFFHCGNAWWVCFDMEVAFTVSTKPFWPFWFRVFIKESLTCCALHGVLCLVLYIGKTLCVSCTDEDFVGSLALFATHNFTLINLYDLRVPGLCL